MIAGACLITLPTPVYYVQKKKKASSESLAASSSDEGPSQLSQADKQETERR